MTLRAVSGVECPVRQMALLFTENRFATVLDAMGSTLDLDYGKNPDGPRRALPGLLCALMRCWLPPAPGHYASGR